MYMRWIPITHLAAFSFPLTFDILRAPEAVTALRRPEFVSLDAAANFEPDFARSARTAGIPMDPRDAVRSFLKAVDLTMSTFEVSSLDLFFPLVGVVSSGDSSRNGSASELSDSPWSESSSRGLLLTLWVVIRRLKSGGIKGFTRMCRYDLYIIQLPTDMNKGENKVCEKSNCAITHFTDISPG
jgi:hypothetical protein